jgi:signal transduction histidine kinase/DNA-binding response OmpR family regulator/serine phosphatase RsbU (regulator of sigma subunit)
MNFVLLQQLGATFMFIKYLWQIVLIAVAYFSFAKIAMFFASLGYVTPIWPSSGIALAAILLLGRRFWPGILLGSLLIESLHYELTFINIVTVFGIGIGNTLEPLLAALLVHRFIGYHYLLNKAQDVFKFIVITLLSPVVSATIGTTTLCLGNNVPWSDYGNIWWTWWLSAVIGMIIFTPLLLAWFTPSGPLKGVLRQRIIELVLLLSLVIGISQVAFGGGYPVEYMLIPVLMWSAFRFEQRGTTLLIMIVSVIAILGTANGFGSFVRESLNESLLLLQSFVGVIAITTLVLSSIITERLQAESRLKKANIELQQLDKLKDEFLANTSHELRTPLNGIIGIADSLIDGAAGELTDQTKANLAMIVSSGKRLSHLVNDILDVSKLKQKNIELQLKPVGLREIVEVVLTLSKPLVAQKPVQLINAIKPDLPPAYADENRLQQIFYNLIGNAIKFTDSGHIEISAEIKKGDEILVITVTDTGIGIPEDKLDNIFQSFEQADGGTARKYGGTGLGLAVTKPLIQLHGGDIWVQSTPGVGSQFTFTLPISEKPIESQPNQASSVSHYQVTQGPISTEPSTIAPSPIPGKFKILAVDDEPVNLQVLVNHLSLQHYTIFQASSGIEALTLIEQGLKPDIILLDVMMPQMTGYEVTQKLREKWQADELPILLLTAKNQVADLVTGLETGANDYLTKPISKDELLVRIKTHIHIKELQAEALRVAKENEEQLRQFLEAMPVGVFVLDENGQPHYINQAALQILSKAPSPDTPPEQLPEVYQACIAGTHQSYPTDRQPLVQALKGKPTSIDDMEIHQDHQVIPVEIKGTPIFDEQGHVIYAIAAIQDISERLRREKAERAREAAEAVNQAIMESIQYAKLIQSALLPNMEQVKIYLPDSFFIWMPRDIVGGDMVYTESFEQNFIIALMDCTGHGVPGAFMTMVATTHLKRIIKDEGCYEPSDILKRLNFLVKTSLQQDTEYARSDDGLDAAVCFIKPHEKILKFAGAKLPLYYLSHDQLQIIKGDKQSLGYKKSNVDFQFTTHTIEIEPGLCCYLTTDGFIDQLGGSKRFPFGNKRFKKLLMDNHHLPFAEQSEKLLQAFKEYKGNNNRQDDVTVVGFGI